MGTIYHIRRPLLKACGNNFYRDRRDRGQGTYCGAAEGLYDVSARAKAPFWSAEGVDHAACEQCVATRTEETAPDVRGADLADAAYERGERLGAPERGALEQATMLGSDSYSVVRLGKRWALRHPLASGFGLFDAKYEAIAAWEALLAKWRRMAALEAQEKRGREG